MVSLGVATSVTNYEELKRWFEPLRDDAALLAEVSRAAKEYTSKHQGATDAIVRALFM